MNTRTERTGNMLIEQPVGQQWWDNTVPEAIIYTPFKDFGSDWSAAKAAA